MKQVFASVIIFILICCVAAQAEEDDYICVKPGDSGYDVRIVLEAAYHLGFLEELDDEMDKYIEEYIPAVQKLEEAFSLQADGIIHLSEIELIDGMICPGMKGEAIKNTLAKLANHGYILDLPENQSFYDNDYIENVKKAEEALALTPDGCLTSLEQKVIDDLEWIIPEPLTKLDITYDKGTAVLKWSASKNATEYRIERDGQFVAAVKETTWTDHDIKRGNQYVYKVQPFRYGMDSLGKTKEFVAELISLKKGYTVIFGHYEQDNKSGRTEPIEWIVLDYDEKGQKVLLLSKYGLDAKPYYSECEEITWEKSSLRKWLNGQFMKTAFTKAEQAFILITQVDNSASQGYSKWKTKGGNNTKDRIFLLSYAEANRYLNVTNGNNQNFTARATPTKYAISKGAMTGKVNQTSEGEASGRWWLRSPGDLQQYAAEVLSDGSLGHNLVNSTVNSVRPALWIKLDAGIFSGTNGESSR